MKTNRIEWMYSVSPTKPDFRLPLRVIEVNGIYEIWTAQDDRPGSQNNYMVAGGIQHRDEAALFAAAPELLEALKGAMEVIQLYAEQAADTPFDGTNFENMKAKMRAACTAIAKAQTGDYESI